MVPLGGFVATDRLVRVLDQYRDRLHSQGDQDHDDELDYLQQVLESPFMIEFLTGKISQEDSARIQEATSEVLSAFANKEEEGRLSPQSRRKRQLARQRSLRALKMAITPQGSPSGSTRVVKKKSVGATDSPLLQSLAVTRDSEAASPHPPPSLPSLDHIYISPYTGKMERGSSMELPTEDEGDGIRLGDEDPGLSNSANTLIERTSTPLSDSSLPGNGSMFLPQVNSDFLNSQRKTPTDLNPALNGFVSPSNGRLPPSYNEALSSRRRARSFEKLLDAPGLGTSIPLRPSSSAMTPCYPIHPPATAGSPTRNTPTGDLRGNLITARLAKGDRGLGISISGLKNPNQGELNVFIQELQPGGVAELDGKVQRGDQIVSINGQSLSGVGYNTALMMLQQARGIVDLVVLRGSAQPVSPPAYVKPSPPKSRVQPPVSSSSCRRQLATIVLPNEGRGFGVRVTTIARGCSVVESILPGSIAERDGRLRTKDQLVQINGEEVLKLRHEDIISRLRAIGTAGETLRMVVSREAPRAESEEEEDVSNLNSSDDLEEEEVELRKPLGITIAGLVGGDDGEDDEDQGVFISSVNPTRSAGQSGRVMKNDRILAVDGVSLRALSNMDAASKLRESGDPVKLVLGRKPTARAVQRQEEKKEKDQPSHNRERDQPSHNRERDQPSHSNRSPIPPSPSPLPFASKDKTGQQEEKSPNGSMDDKEQARSRTDHAENASIEENEEVKWLSIVGPDKIIKIANITKIDPHAGLGFKMETTVEVDDTGQPQIGSVHHVIKFISDTGPVGLNGVLKVEDEILAVNGYMLVGVSHEQAIEVIRTAPSEVKVVVCRGKDRGDSEQKLPHSTELNLPPPLSAADTLDEASDVPLFMTTSESDDDHGSSSATPSITSSSSPALHSSVVSGIPDFSRRFERQSWRERHEEERKRLWERFELRREHYNRHLKEQEEELLRAEKELEERKQRMEEAEEKRRQEEKKTSLLAGFNYSSAYHSSMSFFNKTESALSPGVDSSHNTESQRDSDSSSALSPVPGSGLWETSTTEVELMKGPEGLGFSILDFADPANTGDKVILVCSLIPGGVAERDNRLQVGDRLLSVNGVSVVDHSLQFAVQQLTSIQRGIVRLMINHPIPASPDLDSTSGSFSPDTVQQLIQGAMEDEGEDTENEDNDDDKRSTLKQGASLQLNTDEDEDEDEREMRLKLEKLRMSATNSRNSRKGQRNSPAPEGFGSRLSDREDAVTPQLRHDSRASSLKRSSNEQYEFENEDPMRGGSLKRGMSPRNSGSRKQLGGHTGIENRITVTDPSGLSRSSTLVGSTSEETLVSSSMQDIRQSPTTSSKKGVSQVSGQGRGKHHHHLLEPRVSGRGARSQAAGGGVTSAASAVLFTPSQETYMDGLSPDTSDTGEPSGEMDTEPREIEIEKGSIALGMTIAEDKGFFVVKKIDASSMLAYDQRIRVGDRILAINNKLLDGLPLQKAKGVLKRASSSKSPRVKITYLPAQAHQGFSLPYTAASKQPEGSSGATTTLHHPPQATHYTPGQTIPHTMHPLPPTHSVPSMIPQSATPIHSSIPVPGPPNLPLNVQQQQQQQTFQWVQSQQLQQRYNPTGISPHGHYLEHPTPIKPIPHIYTPYRDSTMATGMINPTPPTQQYQVPWNMEYTMTPQATQMTPPQGVWVAYREPPQYSQYLQPSQFQQPVPSQLHQSQMMASPTAPKSVPPQQPIHTTPQDSEKMLTHRRPPPAYPHGMVDNFNQQYQQQQQQFESSHYDSQQTSMEEKELSQKQQAMWHQDSASSIFSDQGAGANYSGLPTDPQGRGAGGAIYSGLSPGSQDSQSRPRVVDLVRDSAGSLGISLYSGEGPGGGVYIMNLSPACQAVAKGRLNPRDRILEVNGRDLRHATQDEAVNVIKMAGSPVRIVVQSSARTVHSSPRGCNSNNSSWALEEEENEHLRQRFPNANGHLFEVVLHMGQTGLGLSIWQMNTSQSSPPRGVVIMQVQPGGVADQSGKIKVGDEILQVNDMCVMGWSHQKVSELLSHSLSVVNLVIVRPVPVSNLQQAQRSSDQLQRGHLENQGAPTDGGSNNKSSSGGGSGGGGDAQTSRGGAADLLFGLPLVRAVSLKRDDEIGLGFTVSEVESRVVITDIIQGGPAELEGTLQVGDQILSVDSHKVVGMKYERATNLLQQARASGSVTLVVASKGQPPATPRAFSGKKSLRKKPKEMAEKRMRVRSEGMNIRNNAGKITRLGSRRRPVSVDGDIAYSGGISDQKSSEPSVSTDLSPHNELLVLDPHNGGDHGKAEMFTNSPAQSAESTTVPSEDQDVEVVELWKGQAAGLGMMIMEDEVQGGIVVDRLVPGEVAHRSGQIRPGDTILAVNRENVSTSTQDHVIQLLQACRGTVELTVRHVPRGHSTLSAPTPDHADTSPAAAASYGQHYSEFSNSSSTRGSGRSKKSQTPHGQDSIPSFASPHGRGVRGATPMQKDTSLEEVAEDDYLHKQSLYRDVVGQSVPDSRQHLYQQPHITPAPEFQQPPGNIKVVHLNRGSGGLGFSIVGGKGSPNGDLPICVKSVSKDSAAGREGGLKPRDVILSVNGVSFRSVTHQFAVNTLKRLQGDVEVVAQSSS